MIKSDKLTCPKCENIIRKVNKNDIIIEEELHCKKCKSEYNTIIIRKTIYEMKKI